MISNINKWGGGWGGLHQRGTNKKQVEYIKIQVIIPILKYQVRNLKMIKNCIINLYEQIPSEK